jgi:ribonuclease HI
MSTISSAPTLHIKATKTMEANTFSYLTEDDGNLSAVINEPIVKEEDSELSISQLVSICSRIAAQYPTTILNIAMYNVRHRGVLLKNTDLPSNANVLFRSDLPSGDNIGNARLNNTEPMPVFVRTVPKSAADEAALLTRPATKPRRRRKSRGAKQPTFTPTENTLYVGTDGSFHNARNGGGTYAWLASDGRHAYGEVPDGEDIETCELYAILNLLTNIKRKEDIRILVDSRAALRILNTEDSKSTASKSSRAVARQIRFHLGKCENVTFGWVKGHNGNPLNDGADRLSRNARIAKVSHNPGSMEAIAENIITDVMAVYKARNPQKLLAV